MRVGTVKEIKNHEYRVGLTPESVRELVVHGHEVWVEAGAGLGIGAMDSDYAAAGAKLQPDAKTVAEFRALNFGRFAAGAMERAQELQSRRASLRGQLLLYAPPAGGG